MPAGGSGTPTGISVVQSMTIVKRIGVESGEALRGVDLTLPVERVVSDALFGRCYPHRQVGFRERIGADFDLGDEPELIRI
jgi:hypothetical protein